jgi:uncharacterized damage-inducible protein DinB
METQPEATVVEFVLYNRWANRQLLALCMALDEGLLTAPIPGAYGSIRETFKHVLRAEAGFLKRIHGSGPQPPFMWEETPSLAQLAAFEDVVSEAFLDTLQRVPPTQNVHEEGNGWTFDYQARLIFMSLMYHGIAHRTDITTFLNSRGVALPELDVWGYQAAYPERFQAMVVKLAGE